MFVSVIVPCLNEGDHIGSCLDSILANDYPQEALEVLVVDGMSDDDTPRIVQRYLEQHSSIKLLDNPTRTTPAALNLGLTYARGDVIMRMDAHTTYPPNYISGLVAWLDRSGADNVGGVCLTVPSAPTSIARAIALGNAHPFGVGNAYFRIGTRQPRWVDTVPFGCYRREVFDRIGLFDEDLLRNQDDEFNHRLLRRGGRILLVPDIVSYYHARRTLANLWRMFYQYGYFKPLVVRKLGAILTVRQVVPALFVMGLCTSAAAAPWSGLMRWTLGVLATAYGIGVVASVVPAALRHGLRIGVALCFVFPVIHFGYGVGFLKGALDFILLRRGATQLRSRPSR